MTHPRYLMAIAIALLVSGCGTTVAAGTPALSSGRASLAVTTATAHPPSATTTALTLLTEPQAGIGPWLSAIARAKHTIDVNEYLLTDSTYLTALKTAAARGVTVDVIIDGNPYDDASAVRYTTAALAGSRVHLKVAPTRFEGAYAFDHAKYLVIDAGYADANAILGSPNGTASAFDGTNAEVAVTTTNPAITHALATVFQADWTGTPAGAMPRYSLVLSPGSQNALVRLLDTSGPVAVTTEELGDAPALYQALEEHGSQARILVPAHLSAEDQGYAAQLVHAGVQVRTLVSPYVHAKLIVTAKQTFVGSQNFSVVSLNDNREVGLVTTSAPIHTQALAWFNALWVRATPWNVSTTTHASSPTTSTSAPYLPDGDTMAQVQTLWGKPASISHNTYQGVLETVWYYSSGTVYFEHQFVSYVSRESKRGNS